MTTHPLISRPTLLCILDGFGLNPKTEGNAVALAKKPTIDGLLKSCPHTTLTTHGESVGLPAGQMGNSEVGHLNIGAGREVEQWLLRIGRALSGPYLHQSTAWQSFCSANKSSRRIHVIGLYSTGGVHSHAEHLHLLLARLTADYSGAISLHLFTDGRDTAPHSAADDIATLSTIIKRFPTCSIATIGGRFFGMDRDKRWERVKKAYDAIALAQGARAESAESYIRASYAAQITDEFIEPAVINNPGISASDGVLFFNFREDRMREISTALCAPHFDGFERTAPVPDATRVLCFTEYDSTTHLPFLFAPIEIKNHLGEYVSSRGGAQFRAAETEKYPHVTYFLNGGVEEPYPGEERCLVPSPREVKTYDEKPEMSAFGITEKVVEAIKSNRYSLIVVNLANCDMVGHTGSLPAAIKAVETVDSCLAEMLAAITAVDGQAVIFADHGNAEQMINYEDNSPFTSHTTFPVPLIVFNAKREITLASGGALCDVAPTALALMGLPQPKEMTGKSLIVG